jgi:hypothetical protein
MINSLAGRPLPTRLVRDVFLRSSRRSPLAERWRHEVEEIFRQRPPAFIVLEQANPADPQSYVLMFGIRPDEPISVLKDALERRYVPDRRIGRFAFFRRATGPVPASTTHATASAR